MANNQNRLSNLPNAVLNRIFDITNERNLLALATTSTNMGRRALSYLTRSGRVTRLQLNKLSHKLAKNRKEGKNWKKRPKNNNNNGGGIGSGPRRLVF